MSGVVEKVLYKEVLDGIYGKDIGMIMKSSNSDLLGDFGKNLKAENIEGKSKRNVINEELYKVKRKSEIIYWENTFKEIICKEFTIRSGKKLRKEPEIFIDEEYDFMKSKIDRKIVKENSILLCKILYNLSRKTLIDESILLECQHNMRVTNTDKCYIAFLINGQQFIFREVDRDEEAIKMLIEKEKEFYYGIYVN